MAPQNSQSGTSVLEQDGTLHPAPHLRVHASAALAPDCGNPEFRGTYVPPAVKPNVDGGGTVAAASRNV